jgi:preprotein translocase subunit YajC
MTEARREALRRLGYRELQVGDRVYTGDVLLGFVTSIDGDDVTVFQGENNAEVTYSRQSVHPEPRSCSAQLELRTV